VNFDGDVSMIGRFIPIHITEALPNSLRGLIVPSDSRRVA
jgi:tRNA-2-methylthio-N6-dimethylallyladenosine synthase